MIEFLFQLFDLTRGQRVFGQNVVWVVFSFMVALLFSIRLKRNAMSNDARILMLGIVWVAIGAGAHRLYYTIKRALEAWIGTDYWIVEWMNTHGDWTLAGSLAVVIGYTFHLSSYLKQKMPGWWIPVCVGSAVLLFLLCAHMIPEQYQAP